MWYRVDFNRFIYYMLPPLLRTGVLIAIMQVLIVPLLYLYNRFITNKTATDRKLNISGNVQYLQKALNDAFFLEHNQIYISTPDEQFKRALYYKTESQPNVACYMRSENTPLYIWKSGDSVVEYNFIVHIPSFLCTSLIADEDEYKGIYLQKIKDIINQYKPAGRMYNIELYDYE